MRPPRKGVFVYLEKQPKSEAALNDKLAYPIPELSRLTGIHPQTLWEYTRSGKLPSIRFGRRVLIPAKAVNDWLEGRLSLD